MHRRTLALSLGSTLVALLVLLMSATAMAAGTGYTFTPVAFLGDAAPGGGQLTGYFAPTALNNHGDLGFDADLTGNHQEGVFLASGGRILPIMRYGQPAPGGGTFGPQELNNLGINDAGDLSVDFELDPPGRPYGVNGGLYRWSRATQALTPVVIPHVTPAPGGGTFAGVGYGFGLNSQGAIAFPGLTTTDKGIHFPGEAYIGYGVGTYVADAQGRITAVAAPGDPAPGGGTFDFTWGSNLNDGGDVAFLGHRAGDPVGPAVEPHAQLIAALPNLYVKRAASSQIDTIAKAGDPLPGGGVVLWCTVGFQARDLNNAGDVLFANLDPANPAGLIGLYLHSGTQTVRVAGLGDAMPGGGKSTSISGFTLNNQGAVVFNAALDTNEEGVYQYSQGAVSLIARSGTDIPGVGTIYDLEEPGLGAGGPAYYVVENDQGQVAFPARLKDGRIGLLLATPKP